MKKAILLLSLILTSLLTLAQTTNGYYDDAIGKTGDELKEALHDIIKDHTAITYQQIWTAFWSTDNKGNNVVWDMYSDGANYTYNYYSKVGDQCGQYEQEGDCYNREHSWPKKWFGGDEKTIPGRDLHHIFPTDGFVNAQRSSFPYGEVKTATWTSQNGSKLGSSKTPGYSGTVFEPIDEYKGDFARAIMYMSVRYYGEDDDWGSSGMTNKSVIEPWAIAMLLDWSDKDPVSQKEIDRNNVIYGIQGNRNPFIDHPEFAHIIWEEGWTGVTYNITCNSVQHGSISAPATAVEGTMVTLTASPSQGYMLGSWNVYKTGDTNTTVPVSDNGTFTMPSFNVTVSANFVQNNTYYTITKGTVSHGSITVSSSAQSGTTITLGNTPANGYVLYSYYVYKTGDINTIVYSGSDNTFIMPAYDVTVSASFVQPSSYSYVKVTEAPSDWSGEYLLVYENNATTAYVWTGVDVASCYVEKTITNNTIAVGDMVSITVAPITGGYSIKVNGGTNNGKYIYGTSGSNKINFGNTATLNTIAYESDGVVITSNTSVMRYNKASSENRFRYYKSSSYSSQQPIQLYKKTATASAPTRTIQFKPNGGSQSGYTQTVTEFVPTALQANAFTREGYAFDSWNTAADGSGITYFNGATINLLNDLPLYAQWQQLFNISIASVSNGNISASHEQAVEGEIITLTATPSTGYEFDCWNVTAGGQPISVNDNSFEMPVSNVIVSASFIASETFDTHYYLVTSTDQLVAGRTYLIVNTSAGQALSTSQNTNNRSGVAVTLSDGVISSIGSTVCELTLGGSTNAWTFFDAESGDNGGYLYAASSSANNLRTQADNDANGQWSIEIASNGTATIVAQGTNTRNHMRYNPNGGSPIFSCYASTSNMAKVELYIRSEEYDHFESETIANLFPFDKHTVRNGATLTVSGSATCDDATHLILEDGTQLIHHTNGVQATVKKSITAYTTDGGWYTIATPFTSFSPKGTPLVTDSYDLYAYHESEELEWYNYKMHLDSFNVEPGVGYLYAHYPSATLRMTGTLNNGDYSDVVTLSFDNSYEGLKGWNLLGNPTAHEISFNKTENISDGYYYLNHNSIWVPETSNIVPAGRGFLVKANAANQNVTLNPQSKDENGDKGQFISLDIDGERAFVKMTVGVSMPLLSFQGNNSSIWLEREQKAYSILVRDDADFIDITYKAHQPGTHLFSVNAKDIETEYLHLIDHLTGADIDLLTTPSYSFESNRNDYPSRFQLCFTPKANNDEEDIFAYYADGHIVIPNIIGPYELQVIDMTGRVVNTLTQGVYLVRLITPEKVRIQKIVIK